MKRRARFKDSGEHRLRLVLDPSRPLPSIPKQHTLLKQQGYRGTVLSGKHTRLRPERANPRGHCAAWGSRHRWLQPPETAFRSAALPNSCLLLFLLLRRYFKQLRVRRTDRFNACTRRTPSWGAERRAWREAILSCGRYLRASTFVGRTAAEDMTSSSRCVPATHQVNGVRLPVFFDGETALTGMSYTPKETDVFIATYPKCGTTWMQYIVYLIQNRGQPPKDAGEFFRSSTYLEMLGSEAADKVTKPGAIKTHLPFGKVPFSPKAKYIYVYRNPWDCVVSYFNHVKTIPPYLFQDGTLDDLFEAFMDGQVEDDDYFDHFLGWYARRNDPNVFAISYEEMHSDPKGSILKTAKFLGKQFQDLLHDDRVLEDVIKYSNIEHMKIYANESMREFFRKKMEDVLKDPNLAPSVKNIRRGFSQDDVDSFGLVKKGGIGKSAEALKPEQIERLKRKFDEKLAGVELPEAWKGLRYLS